MALYVFAASSHRYEIKSGAASTSLAAPLDC
jgi:hypothetical protein